MGGVVSSGQNNDDLIDNLLEANYIKTPVIERVFRVVDRAEYFLPEGRANAYKDLAWKYGNLHLSAPCIYSEVMEGLCLEPGLSFLNLGSGTGYLSTMVGLILGSYGVNHGIEYHKDVVQYANKKLEDFKRHSGAMDEFDYCEPQFIQGNCLCLSSDCNFQYDRVYCGAACPEQYESYMKNLLKIGGILVMPLNDQLLQIKRSSESNWEMRSLLPVSFASLIQPAEGGQEWIQMIETQPLSLQVLCRSVIRTILRKNVERDHPPVKKQPPVNKAPKKKRALRRLVVPLFDSEDSSDEERHVRVGGVRNRDGGRAAFRDESDGFLNFVLGTFRDNRHPFAGPRQEGNNSSSRENNTETEHSSEENRMETDTAESAEESNKKPPVIETKIETQAVIEHSPSTSSNHKDNEETSTKNPENAQASTEEPSTNNTNHDQWRSIHSEEGVLANINDIQNVIVDVYDFLGGGRTEAEGVFDILGHEREDREDAVGSDISDDEPVNKENRRGNHEVEENHQQIAESGPSTVRVQDVGIKKNKKREKFDSGLGDEIVEKDSDTSDDDDIAEDLHSSSGEESGQTEKRNKRTQKSENKNLSALKWRRIETDIHAMVTDSSSDNENEEQKVDNEMKMYRSPYTEHMKAKIQDLPLPTILKRYLNYYREF